MTVSASVRKNRKEIYGKHGHMGPADIGGRSCICTKKNQASLFDHIFVYFCLFIYSYLILRDVKHQPTKYYLFAVYIDDLIIQLKHSGCHIRVGHVFVSCTLHADDIALLFASCYGLQSYRN